ncbi:hypothetical protein ACOMHN_034205 [Nucella lapillus]
MLKPRLSSHIVPLPQSFQSGAKVDEAPRRTAKGPQKPEVKQQTPNPRRPTSPKRKLRNKKWNNALTGEVAVYALTGEVAVYALTGKVAVYALTGEVAVYALTGEVAVCALTGEVAVYALTGEVAVYALTGEVAVCALT